MKNQYFKYLGLIYKTKKYSYQKKEIRLLKTKDMAIKKEGTRSNFLKKSNISIYI